MCHFFDTQPKQPKNIKKIVFKMDSMKSMLFGSNKNHSKRIRVNFSQEKTKKING